MGFIHITIINYIIIIITVVLLFGYCKVQPVSAVTVVAIVLLQTNYKPLSFVMVTDTYTLLVDETSTYQV